MSFINRIYQANTAQLDEYCVLQYGERNIGLLWQPQIDLLRHHGLNLTKTTYGYSLNTALDCPTLSQELDKVIFSLKQDGKIPGWRNELYALAENRHCPPVALIERAAMPIFGGCGYGVHVNGLTMRHNIPHLWIARRALDKPTEPGKLDQIAAGGMPYGIDAFSNMQKECIEEASIPYHLSRYAKSVSTSSYFFQVENGIRADILFNYDLWLPTDFVPKNNDGEVAEFMCLSIEEVMDIVQYSEQFKFNANIVLIDLFIRHGYITPSHPDYEIICGMLNLRHVALSLNFNFFKKLS